MKQEIYCGFELEEFNRIRGALDGIGIAYTHKVFDLITPSCLAGELAGVRTASKNVPTKQYYVYVSENDYKKAQTVVRK